MTYPYEIAGMPVLVADIEMTVVGVWHADLEASGEVVPKSASQVLYTEGLEFVGTITRARSIGGRVKLRMVGGKGGMSKEVPARHWTKPTLGTVIRDILTACGEQLSPTVTEEILSRRLEQWKRNAVPASRALQSICDNQGLIWRVLRDGTVWVGEESYPEARPKHELIDEDWSAGLIEIAPERPDLTPGVTFQDQRIRYVVHKIRPNSLRSEAYLEPPDGLLDRFLAGIRQEIQYSRSYPATVISQNANGTLQVKPLDPSIKGHGLNEVPIRYGVPGFEAKVPKGATVSIEFEDGDPSKPRASLWPKGTPVTEVRFAPNGIGSPAIRVGDELEVVFPMGLPITTSAGPGVVTVATPAKAIITGPGNGKLLI